MFCIKCGTELQDDSQFCRKCGRALAEAADVTSTGAAVTGTLDESEPFAERAAAIATKLQPASERTFFRERDVVVTNARFILPSETYAMAGITSVKYSEEKPSHTGPVLLVVVAVLLFIMEIDGVFPGASVFGFLVLLGAVLWYALRKSEYSVVLCTSAGETKALAGTDADFIRSVISALNEAIVFRQ